MLQKFIAREPREFSNGAIGYAPGGMADCLGPFAKVANCPVDGFPDVGRFTAYARGYADTAFSVPACTRVRGRYISGFFTMDDGAVTFRPFNRYAPFLFNLALSDKRYSVDLENTGRTEPRLVVRFCGKYVGDAETVGDTWRVVREHMDKRWTA